MWITANNLSTINALVLAVSGSVTFAGSTGVAVALGVSVARNFIGHELNGGAQASEVKAYLLNSSVNAGGDLVLKAEEPRLDVATLPTSWIARLNDAGFQDADDFDTAGVNEEEEDAIEDAGHLSDLIAAFATRGIDLSNEITVTVVRENEQWIVRDRQGMAYMVFDTGPELKVQQTMLINAEVITGSVGLGGSGSSGFSLSGAGVYAENRIVTDIQAYIQGSGATGIHAASISLEALDSSTINVIAGR